MKQNLTAKGTVDNWLSATYSAFIKNGFSKVEKDDLFFSVEGIKDGKNISISFSDKSEGKIGLSISSDDESLINLFKQIVPSEIKELIKTKKQSSTSPPSETTQPPMDQINQPNSDKINNIPSETNVKQKANNKNVKKGCFGCFGVIIAIILIAISLSMCGNSKNNSDTPTTTELYKVGTDAPQVNTSAMVDYISKQAKEFSKKCNQGDAMFALDWILKNKENFFADNSTMEAAMYYGTVLEHYYSGNTKDSNPRYYYLSQIGMDTVQAVKYIYRGAESIESQATQENLSQIEKAIKSIDAL